MNPKKEVIKIYIDITHVTSNRYERYQSCGGMKYPRKSRKGLMKLQYSAVILVGQMQISQSWGS